MHIPLDTHTHIQDLNDLKAEIISGVCIVLRFYRFPLADTPILFYRVAFLFEIKE